ncbi:GDSL-type esterase/lipase family protein [uncultured Clostridium sp.]|jgi:lysophospholipase L1-like esterase|uniref:GDSL-type esterase/lipase family protein n=1 Tax=uncultured Clostridium sp. TaxID=59620 RepID=UPI00262EDD0C|nr:GDSL-type esterase/lipase family protein [uncultured Clostridium sp.]
MKLICIGDSLTKGYGVSPKACWVAKLQEELKDTTIINKGIAGDSSSSMLSRFTNDVIKLDATAITLMCGSNDALQSRNPKITFKNIKAMIEESLANNIKPIIISSPKIFGEIAQVRWDNTLDYTKVNETIKVLNTLLKEYAAEIEIDFIDINSVIPQSGAYYTDGLHLDSLGHDLIFDKIMDKLA